MRALVLGSAECLWDDLRALGPWSDVVIAVNRTGVVYPHRIDHWATLHPDWLPGWMEERKGRGFNADFTTWGRGDQQADAERGLIGWTSGSSGMFGVGVALELDAEAVVLCGIPIDTSPYFWGESHSEGWDHAPDTYRLSWERRVDRLKGRVFSMSGWTRELLGSPPWLQREAA